MPDLDHEQIIDLPATLEPSHFENPVDTNLPSIAHRSAAESILSKNFQKVVTLVLE